MSSPISGLALRHAGPHALTVGPGQCKDVTDARLLMVPQGTSLSIDATKHGAGGLDHGSLAPSTAYAVWLCRTNLRNQALLSTSFDPAKVTVPPGTTALRRIGTVSTDGERSPALRPFGQSGGANERTLWWTDPQDARCVVQAGVSTGWEAVPMGAHVGPRAHTAQLLVVPTGGPVALGPLGHDVPVVVTSGALSHPMWLGEPRGVQYRVDDDAGPVDLYVMGFTETV